MIIKFFLLPYYVPDNYSPELIALAEGFRELDVSFYGNINYWYEPEKGQYLIKQDLYEDYDIGIYDYRWMSHSPKWTYQLINQGKINVLHDRNDWLYYRAKRKKNLNTFDIILCNHLIDAIEVPSKIKPWSIGITKRVMDYIDLHEEEEQSDIILNNTRVPHNLRKDVLQALIQESTTYPLQNKFTSNEDLDKISQSYHEQTAGRHNPAYYQLLNQSLMTFAVGGYYETLPVYTPPYSLSQKIARKPVYWLTHWAKKNNRDITPYIFVFQYDNFRFWESLYSWTCPIHLDFQYWGFRLPVMPENGKHYLGIKKLTCTELIDNLAQLGRDGILDIAKTGRAWVREYYSPMAVAKRLLNHTEEVSK